MTDSEERRLRALGSTDLLDSASDAAFDRLTRLASNLLGASAAIIGLVDSSRQFFRSALGLEEPRAPELETPPTQALWRYPAQQRERLVVDDAREHPVLRDAAGIRELRVVAYAGVPIFVDDEAVGAFCVVDERPRRWKPDELRLLDDLAQLATSEIRLCTALRAEATRRAELERQRALMDALARSIPNAAVALFDHDLRCLSIDGGLARADPVGPSAMAGRSMRELAGDHGGPEFDPIDAMYRRTLGGETLTADFEQGGRMLELHTAPALDELGRVVAGLVLTLDRTAQRKVEVELRRSEQIHRAIVQHLPNAATLMVDRELRYVAVEGTLAEDVLRRGKLKTLVGHKVADVASDANRPAVLALYQSALRGEHRQSEIERDGRFYDVYTVPISDGASVTHGLLFIHDVSDRKRQAEELRRVKEMHAAILANISDGVAFIDRQMRIAFVNDAFATMAASKTADLMGLSRQELFARLRTMVDAPATFETDQGTASKTAETVFVRPQRRIVQRTRTPVEGGLLVTWRDVTLDREAERKRERQLLVDALTGIPNRRAAEVALGAMLELSKLSGVPVSVAVLDVDHFKSINDGFGHLAGDEVLRQVAATLSAEARLNDTVARWGGEEFIAILPVGASGALAFCERARKAIERLVCPPVERVTISAGIAEVGLSDSADDAVARADARLYEAKREGRNRVKV
jgi:diguanylate cyclase (GGDEF)-like protein